MFIFAVAAVVELISNRIGGSLIQLTQRLLLCLGKVGGSSRLSGAGRRAALPLTPSGWPYVSTKSPSNHGLRALLTAFLEEVLAVLSKEGLNTKVQCTKVAWGKMDIFFWSWPLVQENVKYQVALEAEAFFSSVLSLNPTQSDRTQKLMYSHRSTLSSEKWAGSLWSHQTALHSENRTTHGIYSPAQSECENTREILQSLWKMPFLPQLAEANAGQAAKPLSLLCPFYGEQIASVSGFPA